MLELKEIEEDCGRNPGRALNIWKAVRDNLQIGQLTTGDRVLDFSTAVMGQQYEKLRRLLSPFIERLNASIGKPVALAHIIETRTSTAEPGMHYMFPPADDIRLSCLFCIGLIEKVQLQPKSCSVLLSENCIQCLGIPQADADFGKKFPLYFPIIGVRVTEDQKGLKSGQFELHFHSPSYPHDLAGNCGHYFYPLVDTAEICGFAKRLRHDHWDAHGKLDVKKYVHGMRAAFAKLGYAFAESEWVPHVPSTAYLLKDITDQLLELEKKIPELRSLGAGYEKEINPYLSFIRDLIRRMEEEEIADLPIKSRLDALLK